MKSTHMSIGMIANNIILIIILKSRISILLEKFIYENQYNRILFCLKIQLFLISETIDTILTKSHFLSIEYSLNGLFIVGESCISTLEFEKYDLS